MLGRMCLGALLVAVWVGAGCSTDRAPSAARDQLAKQTGGDGVPEHVEGGVMKPRKMATGFVPQVALTGESRNAKGGAVLLVGPQKMPVYIDGMSHWGARLGEEGLVVEGALELTRYLPEAQTLEGGIVTQGVMPGSRQWVLGGAKVVDKATRPQVVPFSLMRSAWTERAACLDAIEGALEAANERSEDFCVGVELPERKGLVSYALWHKDLFAPENQGVLGNPGGKARYALCDPSTGSFDSFVFWQ